MRLPSIVAAAALLTANLVAHADTVFYNQPMTTTNSYFSGSGYAFKDADNFTLNSNATINRVTFYGGYYNGTAASDVFTINFYTDNAGFPGTLLSTSSTTATATDAGFTIKGAEIYDFTANVTDFTATAGNEYLFEVFSSTTQNFAWATGLGPDDSHYEDGSAVGYLNITTVDDLAFSLDGVTPVAATPEPSSIALLGTGLLGLAGVVRKRFA